MPRTKKTSKLENKANEVKDVSSSEGKPLFEKRKVEIKNNTKLDISRIEELCNSVGNGKQLFEKAISIDQPIPASAVWVNRLKDILEKNGQKTSLILLSETNENSKHRLAGLKIIQNLGLKGVCVLAKEGHKTFSSNLSTTEKLDWIRFVDCVTGTQPITFQPDPATIFIANRDNFTEMSLAIDAAVNLLDQNANFIWMDGMEALLANHHPDKVARFSEFLLRNNETKGVKNILTCINGDDEKTNELKSLIGPLVDQTIQIP